MTFLDPDPELTLELATNDQHYEELLDLICQQSETCLEARYDWIQLTCEGFGAYFRATGCAYRICRAGQLAGLCWVEEEGHSLYVHGLIVQPACQGQGIGRRALELVERLYAGRVDCLELCVHSSNPRARSLYQRLGFVDINFVPASGFYRMRKPCARPAELALQGGEEWKQG
jgi:ribosomal protein S18 acetylase RimI-like enzyme